LTGVEIDDATHALVKETEDTLGNEGKNLTIDTVEPVKEKVPFMPERVNEDPHPIIPLDPALPPAEPLPNAKAVTVPKPTETAPEVVPATEEGPTATTPAITDTPEPA